MGEISRISWTDATFNIAWGCTEVGPGCDFCYARELAARFGYKWGHGVPRRYFGDQHWNDPLRWNKKAKKAGKRMKVFCSSMADVFDIEIDQSVRDRLWRLIEDTPWLDWQLLTKRISNAGAMLPIRWGWYGNNCPKNIWLGITVVNQEEANRDVPKLLRFHEFAIRWLSIEPQLEPVDLRTITTPDGDGPSSELIWIGVGGSIDWVVCGGESGDCHVRSFDLSWARSLRDQCAAANVPFFMKQLGSQPKGFIRPYGKKAIYKWDEPEYWPADFRVQEFPKKGFAPVAE